MLAVRQESSLISVNGRSVRMDEGCTAAGVRLPVVPVCIGSHVAGAIIVLSLHADGDAGENDGAADERHAGERR